MTDPPHFLAEDLAVASARNADVTPRPTRPPLGAPLRLRTSANTIERHDADAETRNADPYPPSAQPPGLYPVESHQSDASPKTERLPSFRHISRVADAAEDEASRPAAYPLPPPPPQSVYPPPPVSAQSPMLQQQPYPSHVQPSPAASFGFPQQTSPASAYSEFYYPNPTSPTAAFSAAGPLYQHQSRRQSHPIPYSGGAQPPPLSHMPTGSSSGGESYSHHSSISESIPTSQTTPIEPSSMPTDMSGRAKIPIMAPGKPIGHHSVSGPGPWVCDFPGCTAASFPTQYLLNSHATSHSSSRPHYCPIKHCPRSEGGKGFKRKNELIRHGLTHDTPGYVCPFCPEERIHRYPRPDNLQRHVRVHHVDKDRDDPVLREVLMQKPGGGSERRGSGSERGGPGRAKGRRRRTGP